ncbi:hypothetical protein P378_03495 [Desulforamulus profundi]|uniref:Uncharacterized protein n=1 Tax=Desulforamulus profundi TaxID=1383067 RepID=A0A2C6MJ11_9FIRM|nr:hypothetical protein [Desulforamulus profundi]MCL4439916.1 hypothetical protein [Bacillota bacterium]MCL5780801.1 hypothetical protein [Bacillota bacterium]PHJ39486.1 hypothetical protein P378_03495 [Desulforamulus profundi]
MFRDLKLIIYLQMYKDDPNKLVELFNHHREELLKLKERYPAWKSFVKPEVLAALKSKGLPVD